MEGKKKEVEGRKGRREKRRRWRGGKGAEEGGLQEENGTQ